MGKDDGVFFEEEGKKAPQRMQGTRTDRRRMPLGSLPPHRVQDGQQDPYPDLRSAHSL